MGPFKLSFYYLKFTTSRKEEYPYKDINPQERRSVLDRFGGVKIYRDSFRVRPYGSVEAKDWLNLGDRKTKSPAGAGQRIGDWRVAPDSTAGIITISRKDNPLIVDKSDRDGLVENTSFKYFREIIVAIIHEFELDRSKILFTIGEHLREAKEMAKEAEIQGRAEALANKIVLERKQAEESVYGKSKTRQEDLFDKEKENEERQYYEKAAKEAFEDFAKELEDNSSEELAQVRALASLGLIISSFAHEFQEIRDDSAEVNSLKEKFESIIEDNHRKTKAYKQIISIIELLQGNNERIQHWVDYSLTSIKNDKRKRRKIDVLKFLEGLKVRWSRIINNRNVVINLRNSIVDKYSFRGFEFDLDTIFSNLINNSIDSFERRTKVEEREISIELKLSNGFLEIIYSDNGVGLPNVFENKEDIFLPFKTSKKSGTGLGMYLVKNVIDDYNGTVKILSPKKGFRLKILLPLRSK